METENSSVDKSAASAAYQVCIEFQAPDQVGYKRSLPNNPNIKMLSYRTQEMESQNSLISRLLAQPPRIAQDLKAVIKAT